MDTKDLEALAEEIVEKLNYENENPSSALTDAKFSLICKQLAELGIKEDSEEWEQLYDEMAERIGYNYPFVTDKTATLESSAADLLAALKVLRNRVGADLNQGVHGDDSKEKGYKIVDAEYKQAVKAIEKAGG